MDLCQKYCRFTPDELYRLIYPKPPDNIINKTKDHCQRTANKRLDKIKMMKGMKVIVDDEEDERRRKVSLSRILLLTMHQKKMRILLMRIF